MGTSSATTAIAATTADATTLDSTTIATTTNDGKWNGNGESFGSGNLWKALLCKEIRSFLKKGHLKWKLWLDFPAVHVFLRSRGIFTLKTEMNLHLLYLYISWEIEMMI